MLLVVLGGRQTIESLAVGERHQGYSGPSQELLDHDALPGLPEHAPHQGIADRFLRFLPRLRDGHPFARGQPVGLHGEGELLVG